MGKLTFKSENRVRQVSSVSAVTPSGACTTAIMSRSWSAVDLTLTPQSSPVSLSMWKESLFLEEDSFEDGPPTGSLLFLRLLAMTGEGGRCSSDITYNVLLVSRNVCHTTEISMTSHPYQTLVPTAPGSEREPIQGQNEKALLSLFCLYRLHISI